MNDVFDVRLLPIAQKDLIDIHDYIAKKLLNPTAALKQIQAFNVAFKNLSAMPRMGAKILCAELASRNIRKYIVNNYIVFYIPDEHCKTVMVIRILHGIRNYIDLI